MANFLVEMVDEENNVFYYDEDNLPTNNRKESKRFSSYESAHKYGEERAFSLYCDCFEGIGFRIVKEN